MAPAPTITKSYLERQIANGQGQGHGRDYQPWLQIHRWNPSAVSTQCIGGLPPYFRARASFWSRNEWRVALVLCWIGAEVREQFPAWPWPHPHPLYGLDEDLDPELPMSRGMGAICEEMGVRLGVFPGTSIPYVWTLDLVLTLREPEGYRCAVVSAKPVDNECYLRPDPLDRAMQKLEAERRYCAELEIPYSIAGESRFDPVLIRNLDLLRGAAVLEPSHPRYRLMSAFLDRHGDAAGDAPIGEWVNRMRADFGARHHDALFVAQHLLWQQIIDVDLTRPIDLERHNRPGGRAMRARIRQQVLQEGGAS